MTADCGGGVQTVQLCAKEAGSCSAIGDQCNCRSWCNGTNVRGDCTCKNILHPKGEVGTVLFLQVSELGWVLGAPVERPNSLGRYGGQLEEMSGWAVLVKGNEDMVVSTGSWEGTLQGIVETRAAADGFTVEWDDETYTITLTGY